MSKRQYVLLCLFFLGCFLPAILWLHYLWLHDDPKFAYTFGALLRITGVCLLPFAAGLAYVSVQRLYALLRAPDIVITVTQQVTPLMLRFQEQDQRYERRERLKADLFKLNGDIETFNAALTPDERDAWAKRPGPYGK